MGDRHPKFHESWDNLGSRRGSVAKTLIKVTGAKYSHVFNGTARFTPGGNAGVGRAKDRRYHRGHWTVVGNTPARRRRQRHPAH